MGSVAQAVLEFDEEVAAPWRPRLVAVAVAEDEERAPGTIGTTSQRAGRPSRSNPSRVGACRPPVASASSAPARAASAPAVRPVVTVRRPPERLRLTHRGRRLAVVLALAAGVALGSWLGPLLSGGAGSDLHLAGQSSVTVESGDTLWSIASSVAGTSDVRALIYRIRQLNRLRSADLVPGQVLQLP